MHDLQTRDKFYFLCENWLAVEKSDGLVDRTLFLACEKQKTEMNFLLRKTTTDQLRDNHLWYSVYLRPVNSTFTRSDRLTCCFVLMFVSMLMNIMYYDALPDSNSDTSLQIASLRITREEVTFNFNI